MGARTRPAPFSLPFARIPDRLRSVIWKGGSSLPISPPFFFRLRPQISVGARPRKAAQETHLRGQLQTKLINYRAWELPPRAAVRWMRQGGAIIALLVSLSSQPSHFCAPWVWRRAGHGPWNPRGSEPAGRRLFVFARTPSFRSAKFRVRLLPIFFGIQGWAAGAEGRGARQRQVRMVVPDSFQLISKYRCNVGDLGARSCWQVSDNSSFSADHDVVAPTRAGGSDITFRSPSFRQRRTRPQLPAQRPYPPAV